jgi:hypothetical protein
MAVETYYTLSIGGTVGIPFGTGSIEDEWRALFGDPPSNDQKLALSLAEAGTFDLDWPAGFLRPNVPSRSKVLPGASGQAYDLGGKWEIYEWKIEAQPAADGAHTKLTFDAKAEFEGNGGIDDHKESQKGDAEWFFEHWSKRWHQTLRGRLANFNNNHKGEMIEPARFREWEFYCGNGGGGGD